MFCISQSNAKILTSFCHKCYVIVLFYNLLLKLGQQNTFVTISRETQLDPHIKEVESGLVKTWQNVSKD